MDVEHVSRRIELRAALSFTGGQAGPECMEDRSISLLLEGETLQTCIYLQSLTDKEV